MFAISSTIASNSILGAMVISIGLLVAAAAFRFFKQARNATRPSDATLPPPLPPEFAIASPRGIDGSWVRPIDWLGALLFIFVFGFMGWTNSSADASHEAAITMPALMQHVSANVTLVGCALALIIWRIRITDWLGLRWKNWGHALWMGPVTVIVMWILLIFYKQSGLLDWLEQLTGESSMQDSVRLMRESKDDSLVLAMALIAAVMAPLVEETIFRGYLYPFAKHYAGQTVALIFTAIFFGAAHGNLPLMLPLTLLGGLMAYAYERTGSLWSSIAIHCCFNSATVLIQLAIRHEWIPTPPAT